MNTANADVIDFETSQLVELGSTLFVAGLAVGALVAAGLTTAVMVGSTLALASYLIVKR